MKTTSPDAAESIAYGIPAYKTYEKPLVYFAGVKISLRGVITASYKRDGEAKPGSFLKLGFLTVKI